MSNIGQGSLLWFSTMNDFSIVRAATGCANDAVATVLLKTSCAQMYVAGACQYSR